MQELDEYIRSQRRDHAIEEAVSAVLESSGEPSAMAGQGGISMPEDEFQRIMDRANLDGVPAELHRLGFCDRRGDVHLPLEAGAVLARAFAAAEPQTVLMFIHDQEEELRLRGNMPGQRFAHDLLRQYMPGFALARQWAGNRTRSRRTEQGDSPATRACYEGCL